MLIALSTLPAPLKADPAPASTARPGATFEGDNSFASLIRRQAEQRLNTLRLADQQALAARVSAAAATSMSRPVVEHLASRPPMPAQAPARPNPPPASPSAAAAASAAAAPASAAAAPASAPAPELTPVLAPTLAPATVTADSGGITPPSPAPTRPGQAAAAVAAARAKPPSGASRTDITRSPASRSAPADSLAANRSPRERKPGTASDAEASAKDATAGVAGPPLLMAQAGPTGLVGDGGGAPAPDPAAALQPAPGPPQDLIALPAAPAPAATGAATAPGAETAEGTGQIGPELTVARLPAATRAVAHAEALRTASSLPPVQTLVDDPAPTLADRRSPATSPARSGRLPVLSADPLRQGADLAIAADGALAQQLGRVPGPATERPLEHRPPSPGGPAAPPAAQPGGVSAAAQSGAWWPGSAPAAGDNPAAPAENQPASRRTSPGIDRSGPEPRHGAAPATAGGPAAAVVAAAPAQPDVAAPGRFDTALQAVLTQGPAQPAPVAGAERSAKPPQAMQIDAPVDSPLFAPALGSQLSLLARDGVRSALLQLHPAEMGPISVEIALDGNAARIDFQALRADTRSLIEASLPALAGALQDAGLTLAGGGVFEQAPGRQPQAQAQHQPGPGARSTGPADSGPAGQQDTAQPARRSAPRGLVDLVA